MITNKSKYFIQVLYLISLVFALTACGGGGGSGSDTTGDAADDGGDGSDVSGDTTSPDASDGDATGDSGAGSGTSGDKTETMIMPSGGTVTSVDGKLKLVFPAGALLSENVITIEKLAPENFPAEFDGLGDGDVYAFGPDGMTFDVPVTLSIDLDEKPVLENGSISADPVLLISNGEAPIFLLDGNTQILDGTTNTMMVTGEMSHFSDVKIVTVLPSNGSSRSVTLTAPVSTVINSVFTATLFVGDTVSYVDASSKPISAVNFGSAKRLIQGKSASINYICDEEPAGVIKLNLELEEWARDKTVQVVLDAFTDTTISVKVPVACFKSEIDSGNDVGALWARFEGITVSNVSDSDAQPAKAVINGDIKAAAVTGNAKRVTVTVGGPIPENIHDDGFDRAHIELKFLRNGAPVTSGGLGTQKLDFFSKADAWSSCRHVSEKSLFFTPKNGDTCSLSGDKVTFIWDQPDNCFDRLEFYILAKGGEGGSSEGSLDLEECP